MRIRFWKASVLAAGIVTGSVLVGPLFGQEAKAVPPSAASDQAKPPEPPKSASKGRTIELELVVTDVGATGCEVEVKPANPSCVFKAQAFHLDRAATMDAGKLIVTLANVDVRGADRNCAVAVTIRQQDLPPKTIYRGFRVSATTKPGAVERFQTCMSCPTKASTVATSREASAARR